MRTLGIRRAGEVARLIAATMMLGGDYFDPEAYAAAAPVLYYHPDEVPKRGGRWRAAARWRAWQERGMGLATRMTSRGPVARMPRRRKR